ncbi:hypothetical protein DMC64_41710 [Amycolatopsis sp. WAC 04197]|uniref:hypothetical protein n=1 Tax=Amycolatopsis sp. WAC 04197 TaxID=2203199 RepID=UPI000F788E5A|nr:hypothetical protein [Amycolatopsis sp. WAC 04197]RSN38587.1 hypothetical protein DMC64_41710 [Amycolatopsis sp. WAC 04197]
MTGENIASELTTEGLTGLPPAAVDPTPDQRQCAMVMGGLFTAYQQCGFTRAEALAMVIEHARGVSGGAR